MADSVLDPMIKGWMLGDKQRRDSAEKRAEMQFAAAKFNASERRQLQAQANTRLKALDEVAYGTGGDTKSAMNAGDRTLRVLMLAEKYDRDYRFLDPNFSAVKHYKNVLHLNPEKITADGTVSTGNISVPVNPKGEYSPLSGYATRDQKMQVDEAEQEYETERLLQPVWNKMFSTIEKEASDQFGGTNRFKANSIVNAFEGEALNQGYDTEQVYKFFDKARDALNKGYEAIDKATGDAKAREETTRTRLKDSTSYIEQLFATETDVLGNVARTMAGADSLMNNMKSYAAVLAPTNTFDQIVVKLHQRFENDLSKFDVNYSDPWAAQMAKAPSWVMQRYEEAAIEAAKKGMSEEVFADTYKPIYLRNRDLGFMVNMDLASRKLSGESIDDSMIYIPLGGGEKAKAEAGAKSKREEQVKSATGNIKGLSVTPGYSSPMPAIPNDLPLGISAPDNDRGLYSKLPEEMRNVLGAIGLAGKTVGQSVGSIPGGLKEFIESYRKNRGK